jgi:hypothetical protein
MRWILAFSAGILIIVRQLKSAWSQLRMIHSHPDGVPLETMS